MEASALRHASRSGLLARKSPLLRLQGDDRLVAMIRAGHDRAFEVLFDRYHARLLAFCRHMLGSSEDAEDVLQEVFANAHAAMLGDERHINVRPWLYRIARNRCLNHLRKPVPEGQESMDVHPHEGGTTTAERVQTREDFRALVADVQELPETQRTALLLREIDALSYDEIGAAMDTTVAAVKSLLVRARMSLAEASQSRLLTCGDVQLELAEAAEGLRKASGAVRYHVRGCESCRKYRAELRANGRALAALAPAALIVWVHTILGTKLFGLGFGAASSTAAGSCATAGGSGAAVGGSGAAAGGTAAGGAAAGGAAAAGGGAIGGAAVAAGGLGGVIGVKAAAGLATAALITAGAVEVRHLTSKAPVGAETSPVAQQASAPGGSPSPVVPVADDARSQRRGTRDAGQRPEPDDDDARADDARDDERSSDGGGEQGEATAVPVSSEPAPGDDASKKPTSDGAVGGQARGSGRRSGPATGSGGVIIGPLKPCPDKPPPGGDPTDPTDPPPTDPGTGWRPPVDPPPRWTPPVEPPAVEELPEAATSSAIALRSSPSGG